MISDEQRAAIVREAESWLKTPFHHEARIKGAGVDCGQLLIAVYGACGFNPPDLVIPHYPPDFALHRNREWYKELVETYGVETDVPLPGDTVLFKWGRVYSHAGIVVEWPTIIHAYMPVGYVCRFNAEGGAMAGREKLYYSPKEVA